MGCGACEQQPSEDCISRADAKKYLSAPDANGDRVIYESDLDLLPSVTPRTNLAETSLDCIRELIREFDNKHPAVFADYMREFNNHPLSEIIEYMWDMHDLLEDIKYRLPDDGGGEE